MGAGSGLGSAERTLGAAGLEGSFAIGVTFRKHRRDVDGLAEDERGVLVADTLFEDPAALVWGDDIEERRHDVHGRNFELAAIGQDEGDLVALEGVELLARDHGLPPPFRANSKLIKATLYRRPPMALRRKF